MKITFLGTADGIPTKGRSCSCTMVETKGSIYLIDAGAPVVDGILRHGKTLNDLKAVFLTHFHGDHCDGLLSLMGLSVWAFKQASFDIFATEQAVADAFIACSEITTAPLPKDRIRFHIANAGVVFKDENITVTYFTTHHCDPRPSYSVLVECEGKKLLFSGDLSVYLQKNDFPDYALKNPVDFFVLELAHFTINEVLPYLPKLKVKDIYFNHAIPSFAQEAEKVDKSGKYPVKLHFAKDNDIIEL